MTHGPLFISLPVSAILLSAVRWGAAWDEWHLCLAKIGECLVVYVFLLWFMLCPDIQKEMSKD